MARRQSGQIVLEALHVHRNVDREVAAASGSEEELTLRGVNRRKRERRNGILKVNREAGESGNQRLKDERKCASDVILEPQVGKNGGDGATSVERGVLGETEVERESRAPAAPVHDVGRLRVIDVNLSCARGKETRGLAI